MEGERIDCMDVKLRKRKGERHTGLSRGYATLDNGATKKGEALGAAIAAGLIKRDIFGYINDTAFLAFWDRYLKSVVKKAEAYDALEKAEDPVRKSRKQSFYNLNGKSKKVFFPLLQYAFCSFIGYCLALLLFHFF